MQCSCAADRLNCAQAAVFVSDGFLRARSTPGLTLHLALMEKITDRQVYQNSLGTNRRTRSSCGTGVAPFNVPLGKREAARLGRGLPMCAQLLG